jgi:chloramphenicol-sensitive protein RarD
MSTAPDEQDEQRGILFGLAAYLLWGLLTLFWRELHHFNAFELIGWRVLSSTAVMVVVLTVGGRWAHFVPIIRRPALLLRITGAAVLLTTNWTAYVYAVVHDNVIETALGYFIAPLGTMAVGVLVLREHLHGAQRVAIGLGITSVIVLTWSYGRVPWIAVLIAVSWTGYGYLKKRVPLSPVESMGAETFVLAVPAAVVIAAVAGRSWSIPSSADHRELLFVALSGVATIVPLTMFAAAAHRVPLTILGPMQYIVPIINFVFGWLLFHEDLPASRIVGFALVWLALGVLTVDSARRAHLGRARVRAAA